MLKSRHVAGAVAGGGVPVAEEQRLQLGELRGAGLKDVHAKVDSQYRKWREGTAAQVTRNVLLWRRRRWRRGRARCTCCCCGRPVVVAAQVAAWESEVDATLEAGNVKIDTLGELVASGAKAQFIK